MSNFLCDVNVWVALVVEEHSHHAATLQWFDSLQDSDKAFFCRATQLSFLRLLTTAPVTRETSLESVTNEEAWAVLRALCADARIVVRLDEPPDLSRRWQAFSTVRRRSPNLWMDAYLAAFARTARMTLVTADRAFRQFEGLDVFVLGSATH